MSKEETRPILGQPGYHIRLDNSGFLNESGQQHLIIQPIEFNTKHKNYYGYLALGSLLLVLTNYIMLDRRSCQFSFAPGFTSYDLIQSFHLTVIIVSILLFVLSYFNFATVVYDFKIIYYASTGLIFVSAGLLIYNIVSIVSAPCVPLPTTIQGFIQTFGAGATNASNIFQAGDSIGIVVFVFDIFAVLSLLLAGHSFFKR